MAPAPIVLVPGFWLGAWAWDDVLGHLGAAGLDATAVTLPGLESLDTDRSEVRFADHVSAIVAAVESVGRPVVLALHSGAGAPGYEVTDRIPELVAAVVYVDSGPATGPLDPDFEGDEWPLPSWEELEEDGNSIEGLGDDQLEVFRRRAVPQPAAAMREGPTLTNDARTAIPSTVICSVFPAADVQAAVQAGYAWVGGLAELTDITWVDLPTGHWPMWSRSEDLAGLLADAARTAGT